MRTELANAARSVAIANYYVNMTDLNIRPSDLPESKTAPAAPGDAAAELFQFMELLFFAYRDFTSDPNTILDEFGFGRAHHRVLHFVNRNPGLRVADLLDILKITKQSLARVLNQLVEEGYIERRTGASDRRQRLLYPTPRGRELANRLARPQFERLAAAIADSGGEREAAKRFLMSLVDPAERSRVAAILRGGQGMGPGGRAGT